MTQRNRVLSMLEQAGEAKPLSRQQRQVLSLLEQAGARGLTGDDFCNAFPRVKRYSARIKELRRDYGYAIHTERITSNVYRFSLLPAAPQLTGTDARGVRSKAKTFAPSDRLFESSTQPMTRSAVTGQRIDDEAA